MMHQVRNVRWTFSSRPAGLQDFYCTILTAEAGPESVEPINTTGADNDENVVYCRKLEDESQ